MSEKNPWIADAIVALGLLVAMGVIATVGVAILRPDESAATPAVADVQPAVGADPAGQELVAPAPAGDTANTEMEVVPEAEIAEAAPASVVSAMATLVVSEGEATVSQSSLLQPTGTETLVIPGQAATVGLGDSIVLAEDAFAQVTFVDGSTVDLFGGTVVSLAELQTGETGPYRVHLDLVAGRLFNRVEHLLGTDDAYIVTTPSSVATVRGTEFGTEVLDLDSSYVYTEKGTVEVSGDGQEVEVNEGQAVKADQGRQFVVHPHGTVLAGELGVNPIDVLAKFNQGYGFGQIKQLYAIYADTDVLPDDLIAYDVPLGILKQLADIAAESGESLGDLVSDYQDGASVGELKQTYTPSGGGSQGQPQGADPQSNSQGQGDEDNGIPQGLMNQLEGLSATYGVPLEDLVAMYEAGMNPAQIRKELEDG